MSTSLLKKAATYLYAFGVNWRLRKFHSGHYTIRKLNSPVISVGNLTVGGTGKTPCTAFIANFLKADGLQVAILSRGYKRKSKGLVEVSNGQEILCEAAQAGDEPYLLAQLCPGVRVIVNADRNEAGKWLESKAKIDVFLLDDGYQHIQLHRDLNLLLMDGNNPIGNGQLLPTGVLREPVTEIARADAVIATRVEAETNRDAIRELLDLHSCGSVPLFFSHHEITAFKLLNAIAPLSAFNHQPVAAFSGIAQPARFFADLQRNNLQLVHQQSFPDHHRYSQEELQEIFQQAQQRKAEAIITTEKDAANLPYNVLMQAPLPIYAAQLQFKIENELEFKQLVRQKINDCLQR
ncbi:MAG: tetraacyldisaccharide 4'-kinase [Acidobacteria bacterium]|nr:tetraacyldisaccharide 4'-kinase [Acidobacteriota bacterium]